MRGEMGMDSLDRLNTLGVAAQADRVVSIDSEAALRVLLKETEQSGGPLILLGGGSNVVLPKRLHGTVALMRMRGIRVEPGRGGRFAVIAAAGEGWHGLVRYCLGRGLFGLENLALIPGSVGAAPVQNIGAYGVELADRFVSLRAMDRRTGEICEFDRDACQFSYRDSLFKSVEPDRYVIVDVTMELTTHAEAEIGYLDIHVELQRMGLTDPTPTQVAEAVVRVRRGKLPDHRRIGNVGSFFKNPQVTLEQADELRVMLPDLVTHPVQENGVACIKLSAAQLIDRAGWKGRRQGDVAVWVRQPLVLVNLGAASGADFLALGEKIRADIKARFSVTLELEPRVISGG